MARDPRTFWSGWHERIRALSNIPPLLKIVWQSGRAVVASNLAVRLAASLIPVAMLGVSKRILDGIQAHFAGQPLPGYFWWLVATEFGLAALGGVLGRTVGFFDVLLADRFTRYVSVRVMQHASKLDLASYEDPVFYDKLERARVQATDRISMIQAMGSVLQQIVVASSLSAGILWFSPWLLV